MHFGQCGFPKSGNYLLFRILKSILTETGFWSSFISKSQCWTISKEWDEIDLSFPEEKEVDHIYIENNRLFLKNSFVFLKKGQVNAGYEISLQDLDTFNSYARLLWTHQKPKPKHFEILGQYRKWIYIVQDGRDVINSYFHYSVHLECYNYVQSSN